MKFRTEYQPNPSNHRISHQNNCMLIGSCFSENIGRKMRDHGFYTTVNPTGILYNPGSINKTLELLLSKSTLDSQRFLERQDHTFHYDFHSDFHAKSRDSFEFGLEQIQGEIRNDWPSTKTLIITLGTAWVYDLGGELVANCHKQAASTFEKRLMGISEIESHLESIYKHTKQEDVQLIFTVSPVRHVKDGIVENQRSKAHLVSAIHNLVEKYSDIEYFPSYEIILDDLRDYRFYENDLVHPNDQAIDYVWGNFVETYFSDDTKDICKQFSKIRKMQEHRPLFPNSQENSKFQEQLQEKVKAFRKTYPDVVL